MGLEYCLPADVIPRIGEITLGDINRVAPKMSVIPVCIGDDPLALVLPTCTCVKTAKEHGYIVVELHDGVIDVIRQIDEHIIATMSHKLEVPEGLLRLRFLSSVLSNAKLKVRVPEDVPVLDQRGNRIQFSLWKAKDVTCVIRLDATWVMDDAMWAGATWKLAMATVA